MNLTYRQASGCIEDQKGAIFGSGYAGRGQGKNNRGLQDIRAGQRRMADGTWLDAEGMTTEDWGPLPCGFYTILAPVDTPKHGPHVLWLIPFKTNEMFGRAGFGIHGDSSEHPGLASEGCIVLPRAVREAVWASGATILQVTV